MPDQIFRQLKTVEQHITRGKIFTVVERAIDGDQASSQGLNKLTLVRH